MAKMNEIELMKSRATRRMNKILPEVLETTGYSSKESLNAKIGSKNREYLDVWNDIIETKELYIALWKKGMLNYIDANGRQGNVFELQQFIISNDIVREYVELFLERLFLKYHEELSKKKPSEDEAIIWIGQNNASYGLLITPVFRDGNWQNDRSEIRHFRNRYWTISHILKTGLVVPYIENDGIIEFSNIKEYLKFLKMYWLGILGQYMKKNC